MNGPEQCLPGPPPRRKSYGMYFKLNNIPTQTAHRHRDVQRSGLVDEATTASRCPVVAIGLRTAAVAVIDPAGRRHPERAVEVVTVALAVERSVGVRLDIGDFLGLGRKHHAVHKTEPARIPQVSSRVSIGLLQFPLTCMSGKACARPSVPTLYAKFCFSSFGTGSLKNRK